ncbi:hypothetical protein ABW19_dt0204195 [Dactylella cylindrospora]|nr:hypothetical protein ABW19_dt0204195 [Dactylella cylindrospora]
MTVIQARQVLVYDDDYASWWYSDTAIIVKWTVGAVIVAIIVGYCCGGYIHAKHRLSKGLQPLGYHRWMVRRQMAPQAYNPSGYYNSGSNPGAGGYGNYGGYAQPYQAPPPVYNPHHAPPPSYTPGDIPLNATKANPDQNFPGQQVSGTTGGETSGSGSRS